MSDAGKQIIRRTQSPPPISDVIIGRYPNGGFIVRTSMGAGAEASKIGAYTNSEDLLVALAELFNPKSEEAA